MFEKGDTGKLGVGTHVTFHSAVLEHSFTIHLPTACHLRVIGNFGTIFHSSKSRWGPLSDTMHRLDGFFVLAIGLVGAQLLPMNLPFRRISSSLPEGNTLQALLLRQTATDCPQNTINCDSGCILEDGQCCDTGDGGWCGAGTSCQAEGCCPDGEDCSGPATSCGEENVFCGDKCMPKGAECCSGENYFCGSGTTCTEDGLCSEGSDSPSCGEVEESCGSGCIPFGQVCCETYHCPAAYSCGDADFECAVSRTGEDEPAMCRGDFESCGNSCMPKGRTCCDGFFCGVGEMCADNRKCEVTGEGNRDDEMDGDDGSSSTTSESGGSPTDMVEPDGACRRTSSQGAFMASILALLQFLL